MALLHLRPNADCRVSRVVMLGFLDGFTEFARRAKHTVTLLLRCRQIVTAGDRLGLGDITRAMIDDHFAVLVTLFDGVHGELRLAVLDFELSGNRLAVLLARCQTLL